MELTLNDFKLVRDYIHERTGIFITDEKKYFLENRMETRLRELSAKSPFEYYQMLKSGSDQELKALIEVITVNETFFFRDFLQLKAFAQEALPLVIAKKRESGDATLRIWSAGCSSGDEPYTLAILASEAARDMKIQVVGTDINQRVLQFARRGVYSGRNLKDVPPAYLARYFTKRDLGYEVNPEIRSTVNFDTLNLSDKNRMRTMSNFDIIFCRNVIIYFSNAVCRQIINNFYDSLRKGGFVFLGSAESMHMLSGAFKLVKFKDVFGYMKE